MTEAHSTLEAVARGIYKEFENRPPYARIQMNGHMANDLALAAIKALAEREPSEEAIDAARKIQWDLTGCQFIRDDFVALYRAMLSQLVKEAEASAGKEMGDE